jgi:diguanylate cyclase (GGDEF)-like protein
MLTNQERLALLQRIVRISLELTSTASAESLLHQIASAASELTGSEAAGILLADEAACSLRFVAATSHANQLFDIPVPLEQSIAGAVFLSGTPEIVPDVQQDPRYFAETERFSESVGRSLLAVPLFFKEHKLGVLEVKNKIDARGYSRDDVETLTLLSAQATIAIQNTRMVVGMRQANLRLEQCLADCRCILASEARARKLAQSLSHASTWLSSTLNSEVVIDRILEQIGQVIPNDAANLMLVEEDGLARIFRGRGYEQFGTQQTLDSIRLNVMEVPGLRNMIENGQPLLIPDVTQDTNWVYSRQEHTWIRAYIGVPIRAQERVIGFLSVLSATPQAFDPRDAENLQEFSHHAAIALTNARLHQQVQRELDERFQVEKELLLHRTRLEELVDERTYALTKSLEKSETLNRQLQLEIKARRQAEENLHWLAITDPLTEAYNRRHLWLLGEQVMKQARRYRRGIAAIMLDTDHFKTINDTYGHAVGDEVLIRLVGFLRASLRQADVLARYGGEEFIILMPETTLETGLVVAERLLTGVRQLVLDTAAGKVTFTVSIGVAVWSPGDSYSLESLIDQADQAMYAAKQAGRDQIMAFPGAFSSPVP